MIMAATTVIVGIVIMVAVLNRTQFEIIRVCETTAEASEIKTMLPKLKSTNFEGMELIRPLYKVKEKDIIAWAESNDLHFLQCACKLTAKDASHELDSKRKETKALIKYMNTINPNAADNIFRSLHNVNLATMPAYRDCDSGDIHSFLEKFNEKK